MRRPMPILAVLCLLVTSTAEAQTAAAAPVSPLEAAERIRASDLEHWIFTLAHDSMRGRDTPSPELRQTAEFVEAEFRALGLRPGTPRGYQQAYPLTVVEPGAPDAQRLELRGPRGGSTLTGPEFISVPVGESLRAEGPLVSLEVGDTGTDLLDKVVLIRVTQETLQAALASTRDLLAGRRAAAVVLALEAEPDYVAGVARFFSAQRISLGRPDVFPGPVAIVPFASLPAELSRPLRSGAALPAGWTGRAETRGGVREEEAWNTVGWIEGSDPELRDEYIVFTAHMDHVGVGRPVAGDSIYNGADDNASGTAAILALARAFSALEPAPRRSVLLMTVSGEEKGLLGSEWYARNPPFPLERTVANVNIDMIGRNWEDTVVAIGIDKSTLGETLREVAEERSELGLTVIDDPWPEERFFFRSDHYHFARRGVPALFFFSGVHADYHRPSDTPEKIKVDKTARIVQLIFHLGLAVAEADERPEWDPEAYRTVVEGAGR